MSITLTKAEQRRGMRYAYAGQACGMILLMLFIRSAFGTLFIKHLGGSDSVAMWLVAIPGFLPLLQIPVSLRIHPSRGKRFLLRCWMIYGLLMAGAAAAPSLIADGTTELWLVVGAVAVALLVNVAGGTFWFPLLHDVVPADYRGRFFGQLRAIWSTVLFAVILGTGLLLGSAPETWRFQVVIGLGVVLVMFRNLLVARIPTPGQPLVARNDFSDWKKYLKTILSDQQVRTFALYFALLGLCAGFLGHPLVLYMRDLGLSPRENIIVFGFSTLGMVATLFVGGYAVDRLGTRRLYLLVHMVICFLLASIIGITRLAGENIPTLLSVAFAFAGATIALSNLACTTHIFHYVPDRGRAFFLTLANTLLFLGPSLSALVAGVVLAQMGAARTVTILGMEANVFQVMLATALLGAMLALPMWTGIADVRAGTRIRSD